MLKSGGRRSLGQLRAASSVFCIASQPLLDGWASDDLIPILVYVPPEASGATLRCNQNAPTPNESLSTFWLHVCWCDSSESCFLVYIKKGMITCSLSCGALGGVEAPYRSAGGAHE